VNIERAMKVYSTVTGATWGQLPGLHMHGLRAVLLDYRRESDERLHEALQSLRGHVLAGENVNTALIEVCRRYGVPANNGGAKR